MGGRWSSLIGTAVALLAAIPVAAARSEPLRIVTLGTSLTASDGWPTALGEAMSRCLGREVVVTVVAKNGAASDWGLAHLGEVAAARPDIVLVEFATNDAALQRVVTPGRSRATLRAILAGLAALSPRPRAVLMAMNPVFGLKRLVRPFLTHYLGVHREVAAASGADFLDHRPAWAALGADALAHALPDGLHPRPEAAARVMLPGLLRLLGEGRCGPGDTASVP